MSMLVFNLAFIIEKSIGILGLVKSGLIYIGQNSILYLCLHLFELETLSFEQSWLLSKFIISEAFFKWMQFILKVIIITGLAIILRFIQQLVIPKLMLNYNKRNIKMQVCFLET